MKGTKTVWSKSAESGPEKRQCTLILCIFGDGVPRVPPILIFTATTRANIQRKEAQLWDKRVHVEFTPIGWMNEKLFMKFILRFVIPIFSHHCSLFIYDRYRTHLTAPVPSTCRNNNIVSLLIPASTIRLTQLLDIAMNKPFKSLIRDFVEEIRVQKEMDVIEKWSIDQHHIVTTEAIGCAWETWHKDITKRKIVIQAF